MSRTQTQYRIRVAAPFRLDLTVSALRRLSTNIVDLITADAEYVRVFGGTGRPVITRVKQVNAEELLVDFEGGNAGDHARALAIVHRILGTDRDVSQFERAARGVPWLRDLVVRMRGVKPPRCPAAAAVLCRIKGIGPWTATIILLRGLGRLDVFPMNDSSVVRNLAFVAGTTHLEIDEVLAALGAQRGMLYYYLLLARLEMRGDVGRASTAPAA
jgi:3-methyladenine DNA glycosylase/8-oxoguanine DNA glycosylase